MWGMRGARIGMHNFGLSAPIWDLLTKFGFTPGNLFDAVKQQLAKAKEKAA
jgi:transketolase